MTGPLGQAWLLSQTPATGAEVTESTHCPVSLHVVAMECELKMESQVPSRGGAWNPESTLFSIQQVMGVTFDLAPATSNIHVCSAAAFP